MQYDLGYSLVGEFAGLVGLHEFIHVRHQLSSVDSGISQMPSAPFGGGLPGLLIRTATARHKH
jgi:hypothetical protein